LPRDAAQWLCAIACLAPLFLVTVRGWTNGVLYVAAIGSVVLLLRRRLPAFPGDAASLLRLLAVALVAPLAATAFSALLRRDGYWGQFDAPSRFLLAVPVLWVVARSRFDVAALLRWVLPASMLLALAHHAVFGQPARWPDFRMTAAFADPLVFGYTSLAAALMSLVSITPRDIRERHWAVVAWSVLGAAVGFYLSVRSGSRTGWFATPVVIAMWVYLFWVRGPRARALAVVVVAAVASAAAVLVLPRAAMAWDELMAYSWNGVAPDSPIGLRITFLRIASELFVQHPLSGVGSTGRLWPAQNGHFAYASAEAVRAALQSSFHNQLVSNGVRLGIVGVFATAALLFAPLVVCARGLRHPAEEGGRVALMATAFFVCMVVSSMSTEIVDLKYMAAFYAAMVAVLCGGVIGARTPARAN
jgi:O-antigen ligase